MSTKKLGRKGENCGKLRKFGTVPKIQDTWSPYFSSPDKTNRDTQETSTRIHVHRAGELARLKGRLLRSNGESSKGSIGGNEERTSKEILATDETERRDREMLRQKRGRGREGHSNELTRW